MLRIYESLILNHIENYEQMLFLTGGRQIGKTTLSKTIKQSRKTLYLNWEFSKDRKQILEDPSFIEEALELHKIQSLKPVLIFDEIHKYPEWKNFLKGFYDKYKDQVSIIVTGSARLDVYRKNSDSLMGRYFLYHVFPFSLREVLDPIIDYSNDLQIKKINYDQNAYKRLYEYSGYPAIYVKNEKRFYNKWYNLRKKQLFYEDIRDLSNINELKQLELLGEIICDQAGQLLNKSNLAKKIQVTSQTISRWVATLENFYYSFSIYPYSTNVPRSLMKEPKIYLYDWSLVQDPGARFENFIATHLLKAITFWNDTGLGNYALHFIRTKDKQEVDFLVTKENDPWILIEAKLSSGNSISKALHHFHEKLGTEFAFQLVGDMDYQPNINCFDYKKPVIISAAQFLINLV